MSDHTFALTDKHARTHTSANLHARYHEHIAHIPLQQHKPKYYLLRKPKSAKNTHKTFNTL